MKTPQIVEALGALVQEQRLAIFGSKLDGAQNQLITGRHGFAESRRINSDEIELYVLVGECVGARECVRRLPVRKSSQGSIGAASPLTPLDFHVSACVRVRARALPPLPAASHLGHRWRLSAFH